MISHSQKKENKKERIARTSSRLFLYRRKTGEEEEEEADASFRCRCEPHCVQEWNALEPRAQPRALRRVHAEPRRGRGEDRGRHPGGGGGRERRGNFNTPASLRTLQGSFSLHRTRFLEPKLRLKALAEIYTIDLGESLQHTIG